MEEYRVRRSPRVFLNNLSVCTVERLQYGRVTLDAVFEENKIKRSGDAIGIITNHHNVIENTTTTTTINSKYQSRNYIKRLRRRNRLTNLECPRAHRSSIYTHHARALLTRRIRRDVLLLLRGRRRARQMEGPRERAKVNIVVIASREPRADTWDAKAHARARATAPSIVSRPPRHGRRR